jgi:hypothetical protein
MDLDQLFSLAGLLAIGGWVALVLSPLRPGVAQALAAWIIPSVLGLIYGALLARYWTEAGGGFSSLSEVGMLFSHPGLLLAGWLHYLAFDLLVGAWEVREARRIGLPHGAVLPALLLTFLFGPIGFLAFLALRGLWLGKHFSSRRGGIT